MADAAADRKIGVMGGAMLVAGNMIGSGVFALPVTLASIGSISLVGWIITTVAMMALALVFAHLARLRPEAPGVSGYITDGMGSFVGFQSLLLYWLSNVTGLVAIAVAAVGYFAAFWPTAAKEGWNTAGTAALLVATTALAALGPRMVARFSGLTMVLGLLPVAAVGVLGWVYFDRALYLHSWNVSGQPAFGAVQATLAQIVWAFLGVESAAVAARTVRDPARNVARATVIGVLIASVVYISACTAIFGLMSAGNLAHSTAPFADASRVMLGAAGGLVIAGCAFLKTTGALGGWSLVNAEAGETAAEARLFPPVFLRRPGARVATAALMINLVVMLGVTLLTASPEIAKTFNEIINIAVVLNLVIYGWASVALLRMTRLKGRASLWALIALAFCVWVGVLACRDRQVLILTVGALVLSAVLYAVRPLWTRPERAA